MSQRSALIKARGLVTYHNELSTAEGALAKADNVNIDERGVVTQRRGYNDYGSPLTLTDDRVEQVFEYKNRILRHYGSTLEFDSDGAGTFSSFSGSYLEIIDGLRLKAQEANGNFYFTSNSGIKKISATSSSQFSTASNYITDSGGIKAIDLEGKVIPTTGGFLNPNSKVAYRLLFGTKDLNNNLILGAPSSRVVLSNTSTDIETNEESTITIDDYTTIVGSEYILLSTVSSDYAFWFNISGSDTAPSDANTLDRILIEVDIQGLTSNNSVAGKLANVIAANITELTIDLLSATITLTATSGGDINDTDSSNVTGVSSTISIQGSITSGQFANTELTFILPDGLTTDYFYQLYRTSVKQVTEGLTLSDIDPGEEMRLVLEEAITSSDISAGEITVVDITPNTFRDTGANLYTNPVTGEGILQANERPPISTDIEMFNNYMFYANTKSVHRFQMNLLSVLNMTSGSSKFIIGTPNGTREYTFVGEQEIFDVVCGTYNDTAETNANDSYITIYSPNDERIYYVWFDKGTGVDPNISGQQGIRVNLSDLTAGASANDVAERVVSSFVDIDDFDVVNSSGTLTFTATNNGNMTDPDTPTSIPSTDIGTGWSISITQQGDGEDDSLNEVLLSGLASSSQAIDETARSLVRVINKDSGSDVFATYLSGQNDLPGIFLIENKSVEDEQFFIATNDSSIQSDFNPSVPLEGSISSIEFELGSPGDNAKITSTGHNLFTGQEIYIHSPDTTPSFTGKYEVTVLNANEFTVPATINLEDLSGTNATYYLASVESDNLESPNRVYYSKLNQPESVPLVNYIDIGPKDESIERILSLRDNLFVFKTDGVYIISGLSGRFSVRLLDNSTNIIAPDSAVVLNNQIYCLTTQGISTVTETGVSIISRHIENLVLEITNSNIDFKYKTFGVAYESDRAYTLWLPTDSEDSYATQAYRYNVFERTWTRWTIGATCGKVMSFDDKMYIGSSDRNYLYQERKNRDRTDFADRNFTLSLSPDSVNSTVVALSNVTEISIGDVVYQEQYISMQIFNRLLRKLDIDPGLDDTDYEDTLSASFGDNIATFLTNLNTKLIADDTSGTITSHTFNNSDWVSLQNEYNALIDELNNSSCDTTFKNYVQQTRTVPYEAIVLSKDSVYNTVTLNYEIPLLEGNIEIYKRIEYEIEWQPQHFGDPSGLKQIREGTVIFDQNNFYSAILAYATDLSKCFKKIPFLAKGSGYWGGAKYVERGLFWGGDGTDSPFRTVVPRDKQRCRYISAKYIHNNAREKWRILGISFVVRPLSSRAYR